MTWRRRHWSASWSHHHARRYTHHTRRRWTHRTRTKWIRHLAKGRMSRGWRWHGTTAAHHPRRNWAGIRHVRFWRRHSLTHRWTVGRVWIRIGHRRLLHITTAVLSGREGRSRDRRAISGGSRRHLSSRRSSSSNIPRINASLRLAFIILFLAISGEDALRNNSLNAVFIKGFRLAGYLFQSANCDDAFIDNISRTCSRIDKLICQFKSSATFRARFSVPEAISKTEPKNLSPNRTVRHDIGISHYHQQVFWTS